MAKRGKPPPDPEIVRRALARRERGESFGSIARDCGVSESTVRHWHRRYGGRDPAPPPIMHAPPPPPTKAASEGIAAELEDLAAQLAAADCEEQAALVRRAAAALASQPATKPAKLPDPASVSPVEYVDAFLRMLQAEYEEQTAIGNTAAAKGIMATIQRTLPTKKQLIAAERKDDAIVIPRDQLAAKRALLADRMRALTTELPRCVDCGVQLRISWAEGAAEGNDR